MKKTGTITFMLAVLFFSCNTGKNDEKSKLAAKKWTYKEFRLNEERMSGDDLGNPVWEFLADGTYIIEFGPMSERGKWRIEKNELITLTDDDMEKRLDIEELTAEKFVLKSNEDGDKVYISMEPVSPETK